MCVCVYKKDFALNNHQGLIQNKSQPIKATLSLNRSLFSIRTNTYLLVPLPPRRERIVSEALDQEYFITPRLLEEMLNFVISFSTSVFFFFISSRPSVLMLHVLVFCKLFYKRHPVSLN